MNYRTLTLATIFAFSLSLSAARPDRWKDLTPEQTAVIDKAASAVKPQVKPSKRARILLCTYAQGFWHNSIPFGAKALELMGKKTAAFEIIIAEDASVFTAKNLATYDAIVVNNVTGIDRFIPEEAGRKAFIDFVRNGGGLFANHSASDGGWPAYSELIGGRFDGHPWGGGGLWAFQVEEHDHKLCKGFHESRFQVKDEIYMLKDQFSRNTHRVLVSLDLADEATDAARKGGGRSDRDFAVSMIRSFGKGRVFYSVFGHREDIHSNPMLLQHYFDGLQYVLGDLKADDSPLDLPSRLARFQTGRNYEVEHAYRNRISEATPAQRTVIERELLATLKGKATYDAKSLCLDMLPLVWSQKAIPVLTGLLADPDHNQRALEAHRIASNVFQANRQQTLATMRAALAKADDRTKVAIINALALEKDFASTKAIAKLAESANPKLAAAAIMALSQLGPDGLTALMRLQPTGTLKAKHGDAVLRSAESALPSQATKVYQALLHEKNLPHVRDAALIGLSRIAPGAATAPLRQAIASGPSHLRQAAFFASENLKNDAGSILLVNAPATLTENDQLALVTALRKRADEPARERLRPLPANASTIVAEEAIDALAAIGTKADIASIFAALSRDGDAAEHAVDALAATAIPGADAGLVAMASGGTPDVLKGLAEVFRKRRAQAAASLLMKLSQHEDAGVSREAWRALAYCATSEQLPALLASLRDVSSRDGARIEKVITAIGQRRADDSAMVTDLLAALGGTNEEGRHVILECLASFQNASGLATLRAALTKNDDRTVAIKALAKWLTPEPLDDLHAIIVESNDTSIHVLAMRGYAQILQRQHGTGQTAEITARYQKGFAIAKHPQELVALLTAVAEAPAAAAIKFASPYLEHPDDTVHAMAWRAVSTLYAGSGSGKQLSSSHGASSTKALVDRNPSTRWSTGTPMQPGMWFAVNLGQPTKLNSIVLDNTNPENQSRNDYPRDPKLYVSDDGSKWQLVEAQIKPGAVTTIMCDVTAQHLKVVNTGIAGGSYWSVHELHINNQNASVTTPLAVPAAQLSVTASAQPKQATRAIDGNTGNAWQTNTPMTGKEWFEASFDRPRKISRLVVDCKRKSELQSRGFSVSVSTDGKRWSPPLLPSKGGNYIDVSLFPYPIRSLRIHQTKGDKRYKWGIGELTLYEMP